MKKNKRIISMVIAVTILFSLMISISNVSAKNVTLQNESSGKGDCDRDCDCVGDCDCDRDRDRDCDCAGDCDCDRDRDRDRLKVCDDDLTPVIAP